MSLLTKDKDSTLPKMSVKPYILPAYILVSALFILYVAYGYFQTVVYSSGFANGQTQAVNAIVAEANKGCDTFTLGNQGAAQAQLINVACLQAPAQAPAQNVAPATEEVQ